MSRLKDLHQFGQSPWYDNIERGFLLSGGLKRMIDEDGIAGVTSNPSIFEKAINGSKLYDADINKLGMQGETTETIYDELTTADVSRAADILAPIYNSSENQLDGFVSIEVSPHLAHDAEKTVKEGKRLASKIGKKNIMIKVPATPEGFIAIEKLTAEGININATLIFSQAHYTGVARAYIKGLQQRLENGQSLEDITSVASFFVSRIDNYIDKMLDAGGPEMQDLAGKAAVAQSKVIYDLYMRLFYNLEFVKLKEHGAKVQRLLFGSTSTKNPAYSDVKYVEEIIGRGTINTLPQVTVDAFRDHGQAKESLDKGLAEAQNVLSKLKVKGISVEEVCQKIQDDGVQAFIDAYDKLINSLEQKRKKAIS